MGLPVRQQGCTFQEPLEFSFRHGKDRISGVYRIERRKRKEHRGEMVFPEPEAVSFLFRPAKTYA